MNNIYRVPLPPAVYNDIHKLLSKNDKCSCYLCLNTPQTVHMSRDGYEHLRAFAKQMAWEGIAT